MDEPLPHRIVPFEGDDIIAVQQPDGTIHVLLTRLCENLGLARRAQVLRIQRHSVLQKGLQVLPVQTEGGVQEAQCLRLDLVPLWLSGLQASRVKAALQAKLVRYQEEAASVLWQAFKPQILVGVPQAEPPAEALAIQNLQQIAELGRAITRMAEQQLALQRQQQELAGRMDGAARVIKHVQGEIADVQVRLSMLESQASPAAYISDGQAAEISNQVKALGELLTRHDASKNHYQSIFAELYRRFNVSSYKRIRQEQYSTVLTFLADWHKAVAQE